jgi:hypothetical protein
MRSAPPRPLHLPLLAGLALALAACQDSTTPAPAAGLDYLAPAGASGWRFEKDDASTPERLVLKLVGPQGEKSRGVAFDLVAPPGLAFTAFPGGQPIEDTGVYELLSRELDPNEPVALAGAVKAGNVLSAGLFQKDRTWRAKDSGVALCRVALVLDPEAAPRHRAETLRLRVKRAAIIPEDIGAIADSAWSLDKKLKLTPVTVAVGSVRTN